jgi:hypothetical protein
MITTALLLALAGPLPAADPLAQGGDPLAQFARACPAGKPKKHKYDAATFEAALRGLPKVGAGIVPRAWAVTCEYVILCSRNVSGETCPRMYGEKGPAGTPVNGGTLMLLFELPGERAKGDALYAVRAQDVGKKIGFYNGWALPSHPVALVDGPPLPARDE